MFMNAITPWGFIRGNTIKYTFASMPSSVFIYNCEA